MVNHETKLLGKVKPNNHIKYLDPISLFLRTICLSVVIWLVRENGVGKIPA